MLTKKMNIDGNYSLVVCLIIVAIVSIAALAVVCIFYRKTVNAKQSKIESLQAKCTEYLRNFRNIQSELARVKEQDEKNRIKFTYESENKISELQKQLKKYEFTFNERDIVNTERKLKGSSIYMRFVYFEKHPSSFILDNDWEELEKTMEEIVPGVIAIKKKTNTKEYHICLLIRLSFPPSTIRNFIGCSLSGISNIRKRMLKKIYGKEGTAKEFDEYIQNIF